MSARILVVDDDAHLRETLKDLLEMEGYQVVEASSGQEAMQRVVTGVYDCILMDFQLADKTGLEVIQQIRQVNRESPILMMTAHASLDTAVKAIQESVYDFLIKPVDFGYLKRTIQKALEKLKLEQENKRLISDLKNANEQLLRLNNMKSKFLSMVSHDLSNTLMTLKVSFEMLSSSLTPSSEQKKKMDYIQNSISQLSRLIEDLVDWASIEQGRLRLEKNVFRLGPMAEEILSGLARKAEQKKIVISTEIDPDLPAVLADKRRLQQVLLNLLENALRHTPGQGKVALRFCREGELSIHLSVQDTGEGIELKDLGHIFESFFQTESGRTHGGRLGLGLSISREIVQSHGGKIWVESQGQGKGATFHVVLPVGSAAQSQSPQAAAY